MTRVRMAAARLIALLTRRRQEAVLTEEIQTHLDLQQARLRPDERRAAPRATLLP
jgi:hypothetical protein